MYKQKFLQSILRWMAQLTLKKYHPFVVAVSGSVGKSSTKEAITLVLSKSFRVRKSEGNYNNEIGLPLTIIGAKSGGTSLRGWIKVFFVWLRSILFPVAYPQVLVLEMAIDRPGDMNYFLSFVPIDIGVVTQISSSHLEFFGSIGEIAKEKGKLISAVPETSFAVLNFDDKRVIKMQEKTKAKIMTYGFSEGSMFRADHILINHDIKHTEGLSFKLNYAGKTIPVRLPKIIAHHYVSAVLSAVAVGIAMKMNLVEIAETVERFESLPGRLRLLPGRDGMFLLDDTYNASPTSTFSALETLKEFIAPRKVVILGDMLELGPDASEHHQSLRDAILASGALVVILVGTYMKNLAEALYRGGFPEKQLYWFPDPVSACVEVSQIVREEDLILIKGSRGMRMEKITEVLLQDPLDAKDLLCCQSQEWKNRPFIAPEEWERIV